MADVLYEPERLARAARGEDAEEGCARQLGRQRAGVLRLLHLRDRGSSSLSTSDRRYTSLWAARRTGALMAPKPR
jgi:hypothetical protein